MRQGFAPRKVPPVPRASPQTDRVMAIVNLLTEQAEVGATLSEIADAIGQTPGTLVHVLAALTSGGFLIRRPDDRRYHLGPALVAPGIVAATRFPPLDASRAAIGELARELGYAVFVFSRDGDHARLVDTAWDLRRPTPFMRLGDVLPIEPPLGAVFVAWAPPEEIARWLDRKEQAGPTRDALEQRLAAARRLGYVVELRPPLPLQPELSRLVGRGQQMRRAERIPRSISGVEGFLADRIDRKADYEISTLSIPVMVGPGRVDLALSVVGFDEPISGRELCRLGGLARRAADRLATRLVPG